MRADADGGEARLVQGEAVQCRLHLRAADTGEAGGGAGGERVHDVVPSHQLPRYRVVGAVHAQHEAAAVGGEVVRGDVDVDIEGVGVLRPVTELVLPARGGGVVEVQDYRAVAVGVDFAFGGNDAFEAAEAGKVRRGDVGNQRHVGAGERGQLRDFAGVVRAHLYHRIAVFVSEAQQGKRYADVVVEVADGGEGLPACLQQPLQHFFGAGFAVAAGDGEKLCLAACAAVAGECLQRGAGVGDDDLRQVHVWPVFGDDGGNGAAFFRRRQEVFATEVFAAQSDKQFARLQAAAVGADFECTEVGAALCARTEGSDFGGGERGVQGFCCSHARTVSWSE